MTQQGTNCAVLCMYDRIELQLAGGGAWTVVGGLLDGVV